MYMCISTIQRPWSSVMKPALVPHPDRESDTPKESAFNLNRTNTLIHFYCPLFKLDGVSHIAYPLLSTPFEGQTKKIL